MQACTIRSVVPDRWHHSNSYLSSGGSHDRCSCLFCRLIGDSRLCTFRSLIWKGKRDEEDSPAISRCGSLNPGRMFKISLENFTGGRKMQSKRGQKNWNSGGGLSCGEQPCTHLSKTPSRVRMRLLINCIGRPL